MAVIACVFLAHVVYLNCVAEDAFIALRFASNLAHGQGLVWNPGAPPVEGYTDFLWVVILSAAIAAGLPAVGFAQAASIAAGLATLVLTYRVGRRLMDWPVPVALVPPGLLAVAGPFATWSSSGMESTLFTLIILLAASELALACRDATVVAGSSRPRLRYAVRGGLALLLAALTRPEGLLIAALLLGLAAFVAVVYDRRLVRAVATGAAVFVVGFAIYFAWRYSRYGYPLPNTFYAKTGGGVQQVLRGGLLAYLFLMQFAMPLTPVVLMTLWETGLPRVGRLRILASRDFVLRHAFSIFAVFVCVVYTANNVLVGGDYMAMHRFFVPVLPFMYLLFGLFFAELYSRMSKPANAYGLAALVAFVALATFFPSTVLERSFFASPPQQHGNYRGVQIERWHVARLSVIGKFFRSYRRDPSESLATSAIGAIGFYSDMQIHDVHGLVDTYIAHMPPPPDFAKHRAGHGRSDLRYTFSQHPTYVMFSRDLTPEPIELWRYLPADLRPAVDQDYVHRSVRLTDARNNESGYFTFFERRDSAARRDANGS
jgi:hypothetical protein